MDRISKFSIVLCLGLVTGCGFSVDNESTLAQLNAQNIQRLANLYVAFQQNHEWRGPDDEAEFKEFIKNFPSHKLERIGIDPTNIDGIFVNERDGEPFNIRYQVQGNMMGCSEAVIFEATGVGGKKMIGFLDMLQREVEQAEYDQLWSGEISASQEAARE